MLQELLAQRGQRAVTEPMVLQELLDRRELPERWDQRDRLVRLVRLALRPRFRLGPL